MYTETGPCVKLLVANMALEVLRFLMLDQNLFVVEFPIAVPARLTWTAENYHTQETLRILVWTWSNLLIGVALWGTLTSTRAWTASSFSGPFFSPGLGLIPTATPRFSFIYVESFSTKIGESQIWNGNGLYSWLQYSAVSIFRGR